LNFHCSDRESLAFVSKAFKKCCNASRHYQLLCQLRETFRRGRQLLRIGKHRLHGRADRQRHAVAVEDGAAVCLDGDIAHGARGPLVDQEVALHELQVHGTRRQ
jgi:hypothetical protein